MLQFEGGVKMKKGGSSNRKRVLVGAQLCRGKRFVDVLEVGFISDCSPCSGYNEGIEKWTKGWSRPPNYLRRNCPMRLIGQPNSKNSNSGACARDSSAPGSLREGSFRAGFVPRRVPFGPGKGRGVGVWSLELSRVVAWTF